MIFISFNTNRVGLDVRKGKSKKLTIRKAKVTNLVLLKNNDRYWHTEEAANFRKNVFFAKAVQPFTAWVAL